MSTSANNLHKLDRKVCKIRTVICIIGFYALYRSCLHDITTYYFVDGRVEQIFVVIFKSAKCQLCNYSLYGNVIHLPHDDTLP